MSVIKNLLRLPYIITFIILLIQIDTAYSLEPLKETSVNEGGPNIYLEIGDIDDSAKIIFVRTKEKQAPNDDMGSEERGRLRDRWRKLLEYLG